jgi:hypothetical protein
VKFYNYLNTCLVEDDSEKYFELIACLWQIFFQNLPKADDELIFPTKKRGQETVYGHNQQLP